MHGGVPPRQAKEIYSLKPWPQVTAVSGGRSREKSHSAQHLADHVSGDHFSFLLIVLWSVD